MIPLTTKCQLESIELITETRIYENQEISLSGKLFLMWWAVWATALTSVMKILVVTQNIVCKSKVTRIKSNRRKQSVASIQVYNSTHDLDLLVSLGVIASQIWLTASAKRPAWVQNALQSLSLRVSVWEGPFACLESFPLPFLEALHSSMQDRHESWSHNFVVRVHSIMLDAATVMIASAPTIVSAIQGNFFLLLNQTLSYESAQISLWMTRSPSTFISWIIGTSLFAWVTRATTWCLSLACSSATLVESGII